MNIRVGKLSDITLLLEHDKHIRREELTNLINLQRVYIMEENEQFIGWLRYNMFWDNTPFMNMIYLLEGNRRKGYGRDFVGYWESNMRQLGHNYVMTSTASDEYAQHFYHKLGYKTMGGFTPHGEPYEIILEKNIGES